MAPRDPAAFGALGILAALWVAAVAAVGTAGEFPLSDDWAFAHAARSLCEGRGLDLLPWTGASLVLQAAWGAAACRLGGFSHELLRTTTLVVSVGGLAAFHQLLRVAGARPGQAAAGTALLAFCPLWFPLSFTFMTDVPFAALSLLAAWLYARALPSLSGPGLLLAGAAAAAAFLVRQHAVWIAAAAAIAALWPARGPQAGGRERFAGAAAASALPATVALGWAIWATTSAAVPLAVHNKLQEAAGTGLLAIGDVGFRALATLGFLYLPWAVAQRREAAERRLALAVLGVLAAVALFLFLRDGSRMFYLTDVLGVWSLGAATTRDTLFLALPGSSTLPGEAQEGAWVAALRALLTAGALAGAAALVARLASGLSALRRAAGDRGAGEVRVAVFCVAALVLSAAGSLLQTHYYFDRYVMLLLPLAVAASVSLSSAWRPGPGFAAALAAMALYSVAGTHDYLEWNRARWRLLDGLEAAGVSARRIDGGVEYNASRLAAALGTAPSDAEARRGQDASRRSWWWVVDDEWVVSFRPLEGYRRVGSGSFRRWLPPSHDEVLLLRREAPGDDGKAGDGT